MTKHYFGGALLLAALPLFCQAPERKSDQLLRFTAIDSPEQVVALIGRPARVDDSVPGYQSWQYEFSADEKNDDNSPPAWFVCLSTVSHRVMSVTRNFDQPLDVDHLFPASATTAYFWPAQGPPQFSVRLRRLPGDMLLLATGTSKPGDRTTQLVLIRRTALKTFMPWLAEQLH